MQELFHVVVCGDRNVLWGIAVAIRSALENASAPFHVHVIGSGLTATDKAALRNSWRHPHAASVAIHELSVDRVAKFRSTQYLKSKVAYARYFIDDYIPQGSRCIYLDSDLLVLKDLKEAADLDLEGKIAGAVLDITTRVNNRQIPLCEKLGINPDGYFNSGFLVIDLDKYRDYDIQKKLVSVSIEKFDSLDAQDQAALNIVLEGNVKLLGVEWNTFQYEAEDDFNHGILHLIGRDKPWHSSYNYKFKNLFYSYLDRTSFAGRRPSKVYGWWHSISRRIPSLDMVTGKLRRVIHGASIMPE